MELLNKQKYSKIWDWIDRELGFSPDCDDNTHDFPYGPPFKIRGDYAVYGIENMTETQGENMETFIHQALCNATRPGDRLYALDWQHSGFLYDPQTESDDEIWVEAPFFKDGGYYETLPGFYPDGEYYFFIDEHLQFGYLTHPWRREVWIFGEVLLKEFESFYEKLGWDKLY